MLRPFLISAGFVFATAASGSAPSWTPWAAQQYQSIYAICARGDTLWAAVDGGVKRSLDQGLHWSDAAVLGYDRVYILAHPGDRLLAAEGQTLYSSDDGGRNWVPRDSLETGSFLRIVTRGDSVYAYHDLFGKAPPEGALISVDGGLSWKDMPAGEMPGPEPIAFRGDTVSFSGNALLRKAGSGSDTLLSFPETIALVQASSQRLIVCTGGRICMASEDGRTGWSALKTGYGPARPIDLAFDSAFIAMQTSQAIYLSRNQGRDWEFLAWNFPINQFEESLADQRLELSDGWLYVTTPMQHWAHRYRIGTATWDSVPLPGVAMNATLATGNGLLAYTGPDSGNAIFLSTDQGSHFRKTGTVDIPRNYSNPLALAIAGSRLYLSTAVSLQVSDDSGRTWTSANSQCAFYGTTGLSLAGSDLFRLEYPTKLYRLDSGSHCGWEELPLPDTTQYRMEGNKYTEVLASSGNMLYFLSPLGVWVSEQIPSVSHLGWAIPPRSPGLFPSPSLPVRAWRKPAAGDGIWIDASGVRRR